MREWFFIWAFGTLLLMSLLLTPLWILRARARRVSIPHHPLSDRTYLMSSGIAALALGTLFINGGRLYDNLQDGPGAVWRNYAGWSVGFGMMALVFGFMLFVMLADLEEYPPTWTWLRIGLVIVGVWAVASFFIARHLPELGY